MANHRHEGFSMLPGTSTGFGPAGHDDPAGDVDIALISRLVGAAYDGCNKCVKKGLDRIVDDPPTTVRLVELACQAVRTLLEGLPTGALQATVPRRSSTDMCCITTGFRLTRRCLYDAVDKMDGPARRATAATALDIIVGDLTSGGALDDASRPKPRATPW
jgi:hypothetical protein